jgi:predicted short-subunit dehydrogenase-like oxidoreductase (DUF2520 family)
MALQVAIFGMGRFGRALASALAQRGNPPVRIGGRGKPHAEGMELVVDTGAFLHALPRETLIILSVRDDSLPEVASAFAVLPTVRDYAFAHTSGASGLAAIKPLTETGARTGVFHILQSLPTEKGERRIGGSYSAIAGTDVLSKLSELAVLLNTTPITLHEHQWATYHAAAVMASNALLGLLDTGREMLEGIDIPPDAAEQMLLPLVQGTLDNAREYGLALALTGPVVRGDAGTIKRHLEVLPEEMRETYSAVIQAVIRLAQRSRRTPQPKLDEIKRLLAK